MARFLRLTLPMLALVACEPTTTPSGNPDASVQGGNCDLPAVTCTAATCSTTTGTKTFGQATVPANKAMLAVAWTSSEVYNAADMQTLYYSLTGPGSLRTAGELEAMDPALAEHIRRGAARIELERDLRALNKQGPILGDARGTAIRPVDLLPPGAKKQATACSGNTCGDTAVCVIPEGMTAGECASMLSLKFFGLGPTSTNVTAQVVKVGAKAAIAVESTDVAKLSAADAAALITKFEEHIQPRDHQIFGEPEVAGKDRDGNGVVLFFFTSRVGQLRPGSGMVGYFSADDMRPSADVAHSNAADLLYLEPPGASVSMDALAGTIAHEYQHLINFSAKVLKNGSDQEEVWLDEGLATFAEDINGYGVDAFANAGAYLTAAGSTPLTGNDSLETRGLGFITIRYLYEQAGGATFSGAGAGTDRGGIAAIRAMVQAPETGVDALLKGASGRTLHEVVGDVMTTIAVDGSGLSCNAKYLLKDPETDAYTNNQRGLHLRGTVPGRAAAITLRGPSLSELTTDGSIVPLNGGEFVDIPAAAAERSFSVGAASEDTVGLRLVPKP